MCQGEIPYRRFDDSLRAKLTRTLNVSSFFVPRHFQNRRQTSVNFNTDEFQSAHPLQSVLTRCKPQLMYQKLTAAIVGSSFSRAMVKISAAMAAAQSTATSKHKVSTNSMSFRKAAKLPALFQPRFRRSLIRSAMIRSLFKK